MQSPIITNNHPGTPYNLLVRIISGELKGRRLALAKGSNTRPVSSGVLQQVMSMFTFEQLAAGAFADICAGSGIVGFEAISRGAPEAIFVESDQQTAGRIKYIAHQFGVTGQTKVVRMDARRCFGKIPGWLRQVPQVSCTFLDPPFIPGLAQDLITRLGQNTGFLMPGASVILRSLDPIADSVEGLVLDKQCKAGKAILYKYGLQPGLQLEQANGP